MYRRARSPLSFEILENRINPVLYLNLDGLGNLTIGDGGLQGQTSSGTLGIRAFAGDIEVYDGADFATATLLNSFTVTGNIKVNLNNTTQTIVVDLNGAFVHTFTINAGNGGNTVNFADYDGNLDSSGFVTGTLGITSGTGADLVKIGDPTGGVETWGNIVVNLNAGDDGFSLDWGSNVVGSIYLYNVNSGVVPNPSLATPHALLASSSIEFAVNAATTIEGTLVYNSTSENQFNDFTLGANGTILANVIINTNVGKVTQDTVLLQSDVSGSVIVNLGNGFNNFTQDFGSEIGQNLTYIGGTGSDVVVFNAGVVMGNMTINLASGDFVGNTLTFNNGFVCMGTSLRVYGGNGVDTIIWDTTATAPGAYFYMLTYAGNDTFTLNNNLAFARAFIDFGLGVDKFNPPIGAIPFPMSIRNLL